MKMVALQSGSNGNCIYVEADGVRILFDAGISGRQAEQRLAAHGRDIRDVDEAVGQAVKRLDFVEEEEWLDERIPRPWPSGKCPR